MFTKKALAFLSINALLCTYAFAAECDEETTRKLKCGKFNSVTVCNDVTARSFITPAGPLFNGLLNSAVLANRAQVNNGDNVLWDAIADGNLSSGITVNQTTGAIILPTSGTFLVQYSVLFGKGPGTAQSIGEAQLQQTDNGVPTNVAQPTINFATVTDPAGTLLISQEVTGYARITTTSNLNNVINLRITLSNNDIGVPAVSSLQANAQMVILQIN